MNILCWIGLHKWKRVSPLFKSDKKYTGLMLSIVSGSSNFYEYKARCDRCRIVQRFLLEEMTRTQYAGHCNRVKIKRFETKEGREFDIKVGMAKLE